MGEAPIFTYTFPDGGNHRGIACLARGPKALCRVTSFELFYIRFDTGKWVSLCRHAGPTGRGWSPCQPPCQPPTTTGCAPASFASYP
jgi:hypothetical protein